MKKWKQVKLMTSLMFKEWPIKIQQNTYKCVYTYCHWQNKNWNLEVCFRHVLKEKNAALKFSNQGEYTYGCFKNTKIRLIVKWKEHSTPEKNPPRMMSFKEPNNMNPSMEFRSTREYTQNLWENGRELTTWNKI